MHIVLCIARVTGWAETDIASMPYARALAYYSADLWYNGRKIAWQHTLPGDAEMLSRCIKSALEDKKKVDK